MLQTAVSTDDHIQGDEHAPITLVEYGDFACRHCRYAYHIIKQLQEHFGKRLRFVFRHFPLTEAHALADATAEIAEYAHSEGLFWQMHDLIYEHQMDLDMELLLKLASSLGLSSEKAQDAIEKRTFDPRIQKDFLDGIKSGVNGTPTLFINGTRYGGRIAFDALLDALQ